MLTWANGDNAPKTVPGIQILNNDVYEGQDKIFALTLRDVQGGAQLNEYLTNTMIIVAEDETPPLMELVVSVTTPPHETDTTMVTIFTLLSALTMILLMVFLVRKYAGVAEHLFNSLAVELVFHIGSLCFELGDLITDMLVFDNVFSIFLLNLN